MNLFDFIKRFPTENDCLSYFIATRQRAGTKCTNCGNNNLCWSAETDQFECQKCQNRLGIKSGTAMENSKLPIKHWFMTIFLLTSNYKIQTVNEIQEKLGGGEFEQIKAMLKSLMICLDQVENKNSFEELLFASVKNQKHHPIISRNNDIKCLARIPSLSQQITLKPIKSNSF